MDDARRVSRPSKRPLPKNRSTYSSGSPPVPGIEMRRRSFNKAARLLRKNLMVRSPSMAKYLFFSGLSKTVVDFLLINCFKAHVQALNVMCERP